MDNIFNQGDAGSPKANGAEHPAMQALQLLKEAQANEPRRLSFAGAPNPLAVQTSPKMAETNVHQFLFTGAIAGAATEALTLKLAKDSLGDSGSWAKYSEGSMFKTAADDVLRAKQVVPNLQNQRKILEAASAEYQDHLLGRAVSFRGLQYEYNKEINIGGASRGGTLAESQLLKSRVEWLNKFSVVRDLAEGRSVNSVIGTSSEILDGKKLFLAGSREANILTSLENITASDLKNNRLLTLNEMQTNAYKALVSETEASIAKTSIAEAVIKGAGKGVLVSGITLGAAYSLDCSLGESFGYKPSMSAETKFAIDGIAIPAVLISNIPTRFKVALAGAAYLGSRTMDYMSSNNHESSFSAGHVTTSSLLRPNVVDGFGMTAAVLAPLRGKEKALAIGGAFVVGRAYNLIKEKMGH